MPESQDRCDNCDYHPIKVTECHGVTRKVFHLCEVCCSTLLGSATEHESLYTSTERKLMKGQAWGINYVADIVAGKIKRE